MDKISFQLLYQKYLAGNCSSEELDAFHAYLLKPEGEAALRELLHEFYAGMRHHSATLVDTKGNLVPAPGSSVLPYLMTRKRRSRRRAVGLLLTGLTIIAGAAGLYFHENKEPAMTAHSLPLSATTAPAESRRILLPDNSVVFLNAASRIDFPEQFGPDAREVSLTGEASFDIKHAPEHPFLIHTGNITIRVLGTAFNVNAYPERRSVTVSVSRGRVQVIRDRDTLATLGKGQLLKVNNETGAKPVRRNVPAASVSDWQNGNLDYDDQTLSEVVADLSRVFNAKILIDNPKLKSVRINTRLRKDQGLAQTLEILEKLTDCHIVYSDNFYLIQ